MHRFRRPLKMAMKPLGKPGLEDDSSPIHRIRITLTSRNVKNLEKGAPWAHIVAPSSSASSLLYKLSWAALQPAMSQVCYLN